MWFHTIFSNLFSALSNKILDMYAIFSSGLQMRCYGEERQCIWGSLQDVKLTCKSVIPNLLTRHICIEFAFWILFKIADLNYIWIPEI